MPGSSCATRSATVATLRPPLAGSAVAASAIGCSDRTNPVVAMKMTSKPAASPANEWKLRMDMLR